MVSIRSSTTVRLSKYNCCVDNSGGTMPYQQVDELAWTEAELVQGKPIKVRGFPKDKKVKLFRVTVSANAPGCRHQ